MEQTIEAALQWVRDGKPCVYRYGFAFKGARARKITSEKATELLQNKNWGFDGGFYDLSWTTINGEPTLEFNELSENDMY